MLKALYHYNMSYNRIEYLKKYRKTNKEKIARKMREKRAEMYGKQCYSCSSSLDGESKRLCKKCLKNQGKAALKARAKRKQEGNCCIRCGKQDIMNRKANLDGTGKPKEKLCKTCYLKRISTSTFKTNKYWKELLDLFNKQKGVCAYSGRKLVIGDNASIDHILPRVRGGADTLNNLHWVSYKVNLMKRGLTEKEFFKLINSILAIRKPSQLHGKSKRSCTL